MPRASIIVFSFQKDGLLIILFLYILLQLALSLEHFASMADFVSVAIIPIAESAVLLVICRELFEHFLLRFPSTADSKFLFEELQFQEACCFDWLLS